MHTARRRGRQLSFTAVVLLGAVSQAAAQITTSTALPVAKGETIVRLQSKYLRATDDPGPTDRKLSVWSFPTVVVHGATKDLALFGIFPLLDKQLRVTTPAGRRTRGDSGLGDVTLLARYTAAQWDAPGETKRLAPFVAIQVPTGRDDQSDSLGTLPQPLQLGSGSWDPSLGVVYTWQTLQREIDSSVSYTFNREANGFEFGDEARFDVSFQERLLPGDLSSVGGGVPSFLYGVLESNVIWRDRNRLAGATDRDSGGLTMFVAPGVQHVTRRTVVEAAVQLPVIQNLHGDALRNDFILTLSFRMNF